MTRARLLIIVMAAAAFGCLAIVLREQYSSGNVYPEYSSQRTDRMGTAAIYEALSKTCPEVARNNVPLRSLSAKNSEVLILGLSPTELDADNIDALDTLAKNGNRVVVGLAGGGWIFDLQSLNEPVAAKWQVRIVDTRAKQDMADPEIRQREALQIEPLPHSGWQSGGAGISRPYGEGAIVLMGTSWPFTNGALRDERNIDVLRRAIGNPSRILFDETHLGTVESGTVMGLVRRFRLQGVLAVALACALLFIWQSSVPFPPERADAGSEAEMRMVAASAGEGLRNLLAHHIPPTRILSACVAEWRKDRGRLVAPDKLARIEGIAAHGAHPVAQWREIRAALDPRKTP
jgi:hypothetical protein